MPREDQFSKTTVKELARAIGVNPRILEDKMDRFVTLGKGIFLCPTTNNAVRSAERIIITWIKVNHDEDF